MERRTGSPLIEPHRCRGGRVTQKRHTQMELGFNPSAVRPAPGAPLVLTVGHSSRPIEAFVELLRAHAVRLLVDVRAAPYSRRHPQFNREALSDSLMAQEIGYQH